MNGAVGVRRASPSATTHPPASDTDAAPRASRRELAIAATLLLALAAAAYGPHVAGGGLYYDDWANAARTEVPAGGSFFDAVSAFADITAYRPALILYIPLTHLVFGANASLHLAWSAALAALAAAAFFWVLRLLGVARVHAGAIAALVLLFPFADAATMWSTASVTHLAIALYLAGVGVAVTGLRARGRRSRALHAGALGLYLLSLWTYEIAAVAMLVTGLLYLTQATWRRAVARWAIDVAVVAASLLLVTRGTQNQALSLSDEIHHARLIAREGAQIVALTAVPFGTPGRWLVCGAIAVLGLAALVTWRSVPAGDPVRRALGRWIATGVGGLVLAGAGWIVFAPADWYYTPVQIGLSNRVNVLAAFGLVTLAYSALAVIGLLARRLVPRVGRAWVAVPLAGAVALGTGYVVRLAGHERDWDRAATAQETLLRTLDARVGDVPEHSTVLTFGWPAYESPGVPIFAASWDLDGAIKVRRHDNTLDAYPVTTGTTVVCGDAAVSVERPGFAGARPGGPGLHPGRYGRVYMLDVASGRVARASGPRSCRALLATFAPGPLYPAS